MNRMPATLLALFLVPAGLGAQEHPYHGHRPAAATAEPPADATADAPVTAQGAVLASPGNAAFGAIQEVVERLESDPSTDWGRVDLESLRRHLVDMDHMVRGVEVVGNEPVEGGAVFRVDPLHDRARWSLRRVLDAHAGQLRAERGWRMETVEEEEGFVVRVTSADAGDAARIRGLGYIGIMATGAHHAPHHWMIATGQHPHDG